MNNPPSNLQHKPLPPAAASAPPQQQPRRSLPYIIALSFLVFIFAGGIIVLLVWLVARPHKPVYSVVSAAVHHYNLTADRDGRLTADFNFTVKAFNPSKRVSTHYEALNAQLFFGDEQIASSRAAAFRHPGRSVRYVPLFLPAKNVTLYGNTAREFKRERSAGKVELVVKLKGRVRFQTGAWKSHHHRIKVTCKPAVMSYSSDSFNEVKCHVDF
ncbi:unnamed protein product [Cuscuta campestris]|uniref:Late embryogenesis abundant protein LEA-2 subgroup domain-containing protein n=1 Tax=Cuscuta campestris TaxID=132261 RepID=A0A484LN56_9ASTE|nr:unnamed protein product [Cuscuta campestris]